MKKIIGILLIIAGAIIGYEGYKRNDALQGQLESSVTKLASKLDGKTRLPEYTWFYVGGGVLLIAGIVAFSSSGKSSSSSKKPAAK